jgi:diguanylate cyclase (GGDEF)-like protein
VDGEAASVATQGPAWPRSHARARRTLSTTSLVVVLALVALGATLVCAAIGYSLARQSDERLLADQRAALRSTVSEFRALFGKPDSIDPRLVHMVEQNAGLQSLKFETDPTPGDREIQPVLDGDGRILGFFTWQRSYPMTRAVQRLLPVIFGVAVLLVGFAGYSLRQLRRAHQDLKASEANARRAADEDKLTGLPNHARMLELLDRALAERGGDDAVTFALIEIDGMSDFGVLASDELYSAITTRLREVLPAGAVCGRIGSNEFAVILAGAAALDGEAAIRAALDVIARPYADGAARIGGHAGLAQAPRDGEARGELTRRAELALRAAAKKGPGTIAVFEAALDALSADQKFIMRELPRALSANTLELHYQPIVAAQGGRIVGVEALLRWTHSERGAIPPATFIPVAEQMGLMDTLGAFVLRRALSEAKHWPGLYVAVNLSPVQMRDAAIVDLVRSALAENGVEPSQLMLEITEGVLIDNPEDMLKRIEDLHALGVRIALDDFGSGYSNLGYLQRFPLDKLKIDRSFVSALGKSANGGVIIQAIVTLGRALGLTVLVEGVETEEQRVLLRLAGCDEMQGYLFAKPAPASAIDRLLTQRKKETGGAPALLGEPLTA